MKSFRFRGTAEGACRVSEVQVIGIEVFDDVELGAVECTPKITIGDTSSVLNGGASGVFGGVIGSVSYTE